MEIPFHHHNLLNPNYLQVINPPPPPPPPPPLSPAPPEPSDRLPQWTHEETLEFLAIRARLDKTFSQTKRNKPLWEAISSSLQQRGFFRSPDQCKSKWKNLVTRFKGSETSEGEAGRQQFPFYWKMKSIFAEREKTAVQADRSDEAAAEEGTSCGKRGRKRKSAGEEEVEEALREFMGRQREMEARWLEAAEAREAERQATEEEWRAAMEALREERAQMERRWREREEERRAREEARAERRHAVVMALLDKIAQDL